MTSDPSRERKELANRLRTHIALKDSSPGFHLSDDDLQVMLTSIDPPALSAESLARLTLIDVANLLDDGTPFGDRARELIVSSVYDQQGGRHANNEPWETIEIEPAILNLRTHQTQCDQDGIMVQVSRQALDEVLDAVDALRSALRTPSPTSREALAVRLAKHSNSQDDETADLLMEAAAALSTVPPSTEAGASDLDARQAVVIDWGSKAFGADHMADKIVRAARFIEEAVEMVQAVGLPRDHAQRAFDHVYSRPAGDPHQEAGGSINTLMALCGALGLSLDQCQRDEINRCLAKDPAHFAARNQTKLRDVDAAPPPSPSPDVSEALSGGLVALKMAIDHIEHMAAWIGKANRHEPGTYSFEGLGEDMPWMREQLAALRASLSERNSPAVEREALIPSLMAAIVVGLSMRANEYNTDEAREDVARFIKWADTPILSQPAPVEEVTVPIEALRNCGCPSDRMMTVGECNDQGTCGCSIALDERSPTPATDAKA